MQKIFIIFLLVAVILALIGVGFYEKFFKGMTPAFFAPPEDITEFFPEDSVLKEAINETNFPFKLPPGFTISIFAKNFPGARVMKFDTFDNMWVSRTSEGVVSLLEIDFLFR